MSCISVKISLEKPIHIIARASESDLAIRGLSASSGSSAAILETLSLTSFAAVSRFVSNVNSILIFDNSSLLSDVISLMPDMPERESSIISVTSLSRIFDDAPVYIVLTVTTGLSISGYSRIVNLS